MTIHLIQGSFTRKDAISIITKLIDGKIKFQEEKIKNADNEEDKKMRENRIKSLQKELYDARKVIELIGDNVSVQSEININ
jgi:hypothetical protein